MKKLRFTVALIATSLAPMAAQAQTCSINDLTVAAMACRGSFSPGNLNGDVSETNYLTSQFTGVWTYVGKSDDSGFGPFTASPTSPTGTLTFDAPIKGLFVIGLKASNTYSYYEFNGGQSGIASLQFSTIGSATNKSGDAQGLSHAALYLGPLGSTPPRLTAPEPSTYVLMAAGLAALGLVSRRRRNIA